MEQISGCYEAQDWTRRIVKVCYVDRGLDLVAYWLQGELRKTSVARFLEGYAPIDRD